MKTLTCIFLALLIFSSCKKNTPAFLQEKLIGTWQGTGIAAWEAESWTAEFVFEENGHYTVKVLTGSVASALNMGDDSIDSEERTFVIHYLDSFGKGHGVIKAIHSGGDLMKSPINDLEFSDKHETLTFSIDQGSGIKYTLTKQ